MKRLQCFIYTFLTLIFHFCVFANSALAQDVKESQPKPGTLTIDECVKLSEANYPLIKKYGLLSLSTKIELSDINKGWLPRIGLYGQLTGQNVVPSYPDALSGMMEQLGQEVKGLGKIQYKIGVDVSQTVWDGGASKVHCEIVTSQENLRRATLDVEMYAIRERVENVYFAILLIEEQIAQNEETYKILTANLKKINSMFKNGVVMKSDVDMVEAQALSVKQQIQMAQSSAEGYRSVLALFIGDEVGNRTLEIPKAQIPSTSINSRPEMKLFERQLSLNILSDRLTDTGLLPKVNFFAQAYYGYPGLDYFKSMMSRSLSFNILAGVKVSWKLDSFYTKKNLRSKTVINDENIIIDREKFLFNSRLQADSQIKTIEGLRNVMKEDSKIIELRSNVRKSAESQLENGVIDATTLLIKISDEYIAQLTSKLHEIQYLQEIYKLKYILNQ